MKQTTRWVLPFLAVVLAACGDDNTTTEISEITQDPLITSCTDEEFPVDSIVVGSYHEFELCGWNVKMNTALFESDMAADFYTALATDLQTVTDVLPSSALEYLGNTNIWLELDNPDFPGGVYHPSAVWLSENGYPTIWADGVQFDQNYLNWKAQQPAMLLHELSHALHHQYYDFNQPDINAAFDQAVESGIYQSVEYIDGGLQAAYALTNTTEYFAELSEAYYWRNDFYPFDRQDLAEFDPAGLAAVELIWGLR